MYVFLVNGNSILKGNKIYADSSLEIELYDGKEDDNKPFTLDGNFFPGDYYSQEYNVKVHHDGKAVVHFNVINFSESKLSEILSCKVVINNEYVAYEGLLSELIETIDYDLSKRDGDIVNYEITIGIPVETGNEYQGLSYSCDFEWSADGKHLRPIPPSTGIDGFINNSFDIGWIVIAICILLLVFIRKSRKDYERQ